MYPPRSFPPRRPAPPAAFRVSAFTLTLALSLGAAPWAHAHAQAQAGASAEAGEPAGSADAAFLLSRAREAARQDRNQVSADLFARAIAQAPQRRAELLPEYADQLTYSSRAGQAVPLYREALQSAPAGEPRQRLLRGLGLALLWSDQPGPARDVYETLLRERPGDADAQRNLARALSWSGRQRDAQVVLQDLLQRHPQDREARVQLAESLYWMGRTDRAIEVLQHPSLQQEASALRLRESLSQGLKPRTQVEGLRSTQSDELDIDTLRFSHEMALADGRGAAGLRVARIDFEREDGTDAVRLTRPAVYGRWRFSDAAEINAELGTERIEPRGGGAYDKAVYSTWLTWWANDQVRMDASSSRVSFDNLRSLRLGITAIQNAVSMDFAPDERQRYNLRAERGLYSDGNRRWTGQASGEWRAHLKPEVWLGLRHARTSFEQRLDNGYFNPDRVQVTQATLRLNHRFAADSAWTVSAFLAAGRERAVPDGEKPSWDASLSIGRQLARDTRLEARLQRFSSRTSTGVGPSGFERTTAALTLEQRW